MAQHQRHTGSDFWDRRAGATVVTGGAASAPPLTWEIPQAEQTPTAAPCEKCKRCSNCGAHHEVQVLPIMLATEVVAKIRGMMHHFSAENKNEREWLGYLIADEDGTFVDMFIPKQVGYKSSVEVDKESVDSSIRIDGVIHSHHSMSAFHSGTDDDNLVANHPVSIVVAMKRNDLDFHAVRTQIMECGARYIAKNLQVRMDVPSCEAWLQGATTNVEAGAAPIGYRIVSKGKPTETVVVPDPMFDNGY